MRFALHLRDGSCPNSDPTEDGDAVGLEEPGRVLGGKVLAWQLQIYEFQFLNL